MHTKGLLVSRLLVDIPVVTSLQLWAAAGVPPGFQLACQATAMKGDCRTVTVLEHGIIMVARHETPELGKVKI